LEGRLGESLAPPVAIKAAPAVRAVAISSSGESGVKPTIEPVARVAAPSEDEAGGSTWPDESAELEYLSEARDRGEQVGTPAAKEEARDEVDAKALPPLDELVERIPPEVREILDDLFRAKFTKVRRIPRKALKDASA